MDETEHIFTGVYKRNLIQMEGSVSGPGSDLENTKIISSELPRLFHRLQIRTLLDIPCGDFNWMNTVDLNGVEYLGADIVREIVRIDQENYTAEGVSFKHLDLLRDPLPAVDLVLCRDCLVHLCYDDINLALQNIRVSHSTYLLTTTFSAREENVDIFTGAWRTLNLQIAPFNLPEPVQLINEGYEGNDGAYADKSLGLWRIGDILPLGDYVS